VSSTEDRPGGREDAAGEEGEPIGTVAAPEEPLLGDRLDGPTAEAGPGAGGDGALGDDDARADDGADGRRQKKATGLRSALEWGGVIAGALVVALIVRAFLLAAFYIPSGSMVATLEEGDRVLVNKLSYHLHDIHRGDVVVFERPPNEPDNGIKDLIKRVIALPGETVDVQDCQVLITPKGDTQAHVLDESYTDGKCTTPQTQSLPYTVKPGEIWVMGDNRPLSQDSRTFGAIKQDLVVGRAFAIVWPLNHIGWL
jgi:signal peptidase I